MAIKQEKWDVAKAMLEGGASLSEIETKTRIGRSTVSKKAKLLGWEKGINQQIIVDESNALAKKSTLNQQQLNFHDEQVDIRTKHLQFIHNASLKNASVMMKKINSNTPIIEHKMAQETINKAGEALGVIDKGGSQVNISNTNAQQNNAPKDFNDFYE